MRQPPLYTIPIIVAFILLIAGLAGAISLIYLPPLVAGFDGMSGGYAVTVIGFFLIIIAVVILFLYGRLNRDFKKMLEGDTLVFNVLSYDAYQAFSKKETEDFKSSNKFTLLVVLGFCILFGAIFSIAIDPVFILICLGIAAFTVIIYLVTTAFRSRKLKRAQALVCLNTGGAFAFGQMHSWSLPGCRLVEAEFYDGMSDDLPCPYIQIIYTSAAYPGPRRTIVTIPVELNMSEKASQAVAIMKTLYNVN